MGTGPAEIPHHPGRASAAADRQRRQSTDRDPAGRHPPAAATDGRRAELGHLAGHLREQPQQQPPVARRRADDAVFRAGAARRVVPAARDRPAVAPGHRADDLGMHPGQHDLRQRQRRPAGPGRCAAAFHCPRHGARRHRPGGRGLCGSATRGAAALRGIAADHCRQALTAGTHGDHHGPEQVRRLGSAAPAIVSHAAARQRNFFGGRGFDQRGLAPSPNRGRGRSAGCHRFVPRAAARPVRQWLTAGPADQRDCARREHASGARPAQGCGRAVAALAYWRAQCVARP
mmetsp:Transcript_15041/g.35584  ORF Transcript_15041/g.35584 Transcript_15041/m.35584 type:complete len:288 (-) Transcript_15041:276-1139(-)